MHAITRQGFLNIRGSTSQERAELSRRLEKFSGLVVDDLHVTGLIHISIMTIHQLQYFTLGNDVGCIRQHFHHAHVVDRNHHLKGT